MPTPTPSPPRGDSFSLTGGAGALPGVVPTPPPEFGYTLRAADSPWQSSEGWPGLSHCLCTVLAERKRINAYCMIRGMLKCRITVTSRIESIEWFTTPHKPTQQQCAVHTVQFDFMVFSTNYVVEV